MYTTIAQRALESELLELVWFHMLLRGGGGGGGARGPGPPTIFMTFYTLCLITGKYIKK
jgi:hypothetical protein